MQGSNVNQEPADEGACHSLSAFYGFRTTKIRQIACLILAILLWTSVADEWTQVLTAAFLE